MKSDFVSKFLNAIGEINIAVNDSLSRMPSYKGFKYNDFDFYRNDKRRKYYGFKNLKKRGIIRDSKDDRFTFTKKGQNWLKESFVKYSRVKTAGKWDDKWRVVIFDIPQEFHKKRVWFRRKLKLLGFVMIQKSVFVFPYACHEEIGDICDSLGLIDYVDIITAESIGSREEDLAKTFKLKK